MTTPPDFTQPQASTADSVQVPQQAMPAGAPPAGFNYLPTMVAPQKGAGLAITALVLATIALLLCWVPIVNNFAAVLAVVALVFGVPALLSARKGKRSGKGMAVASVLLSVVAIAGVIATQAFYTEVIDDVADSIEQAGQDLEDRDAGNGVAQDSDEIAAAEEEPALTVGQAATVGDYEITITRVTKDANALIEQTNEFNEPPKNGYVLVNATVTYTGSEEGTPWLDLSAAILGSDGRQYDDGATSAVTPLSDEDSVTLRAGGTSEVDFVMDIPPAALSGAKIMVEESLTFDESAAYWLVP